MLLIVNVPAPAAFDRVKSKVLAVPATTGPKSWLTGLSVTFGGADEPTNSTAPASTRLLVFLAVPKKSVAGARLNAPPCPLLLAIGIRPITEEPAAGA